ncbi:MAG: hypothetical protein J5940_01880 [Clostridia bacterium]|nr:hypothetical protein [Clostridia bacterium]
MRTFRKIAAAVLAVIFVGICLAGCGKKDEVVDIDANPEYGASIDPAKITENQAKSVLIGLLPNAIYYQSFVTDPSLSTAIRRSDIDYTAEENAGYYPLSTKYGMTSYDNLIFGLNKYFTEVYAKALIEALTGTDPVTGEEVARYKMIGGVLHIYPEFESSVSLKEITADYDSFEITSRSADSFKVKIGASIDETTGTQEITLKKVDGYWYVDAIFI